MYNVNLDESARRFLKKLDKIEKIKIIKKLKRLAKNPELGKPLVGNLSGLWSLRIDKYRAIYRIFKDKLIIIVLDIEHRKKVYR